MKYELVVKKTEWTTIEVETTMGYARAKALAETKAADLPLQAWDGCKYEVEE